MNALVFIPYDVSAWRSAYWILIDEEQSQEIPTRGVETRYGPYLEASFESNPPPTEN